MRKIILTTIMLVLGISLGISITARANQLWEYGPFSDRAIVAESIGIEDYEGTYNQNILLLEWYEAQSDSELAFGSTLPIAGSTYTLAGSGITSSGASITLQSFTIPQNGYAIQDSDLSSTFYITLEPGSTRRQEIASCTTVVQNSNDTATLSGCTRGLSPITPFTASTTLRFAHAGGSQVIFSDPPQLFNEYVSIANKETISGQKTFSIFPEFSDGTAPTTTNQFATKGYVDTITNQGAATSTESLGGISELATRIENASSTPWGVNDPHVQQSEHASSTPSDARTGLWDVWSENDGYLSQLWLDLSETWTYTGTVNLPATTTQQFSARGSIVPVGTILMYVTTSSPSGWLVADGTQISRSDFSDLFAIIGTAYGDGDGSTTFHLPDMKQRVPLGLSASAVDGVGDMLGETGGATSTNMTSDQMLAHTHTFDTTDTGAGTAGGRPAGSAGGGSASAFTSDSTGGSADLPTIDPYITINYIIKY